MAERKEKGRVEGGGVGQGGEKISVDEDKSCYRRKLQGNYIECPELGPCIIP